jgi:ubiquinone/menaquinone biosynthesis C-methylase UbiE
MLAAAERKARRVGARNIEYCLADINAIPFPDRSFDVVIASQILHLLDDPAGAAAELRRVANSTVVVLVCLLASLGWFARFKVRAWQMMGFTPKRTFSADSYRQFLTDIGLPPRHYVVMDGSMPMAVGVWQHPSPDT